MCGIIGYQGKRDSIAVVLKGLQRLEYRGYDSWGIGNSNFEIEKRVGKIGHIKRENLHLKDTSIVIGHTRWATNGSVTQNNAHPHFSEDKTIMVIHNGIVENYQEIKERLQKKGYSFRTETDTEVIPYLIQFYLKKEKIFSKAFVAMLHEIKGSYAILALQKGNDQMLFAREGSPLCIGLGKEEFFIASDVPAFLEYTKKVIFLEDNQYGILEKEKIEIFDLKNNKKIKQKIETITWNLEQAEKGDYPHFMLKEIMEQKETIGKALQQDEKAIAYIASLINKAYGTFFVGCGTAGHTAQIAEYLFAEIAKKHVNVVEASEFPYFEQFLTRKTVMIVVSQSGETADVIAAMKAAKKKGVTVIAIVNVMGSTVMRMADYSILTNAGPEIAVASTKATTAQITLWIWLAYACAGKGEEGKKMLQETSKKLALLFEKEKLEEIKKISRSIKNKKDHYVIGRGVQYPLAKEAALKIKEVSYVHAEGMSGGELKHGTIALIEKGTPVTVLVAHDETQQEILSNASEIKARGGHIIGIAPENNELFDDYIAIPDVGNASPLALLIPVQLLAYHLAVARGCDVDKPRNLAKSVTVK
ncbi:glutamine--fructose-6-phosphate transaminase (isomerizing) [Candidatus Woesearchaeota archaeon]|nr:glutamine--fructose-6-phosphate transaminase (isomerizing) [Candidatus Woesearchaeota archaeon]